ncbi:MAG: glycosyltransferase [Proteobacteria bacterium]|nr:glycosyltransferase [Pseudomonadota bacterium]MBU1594180.1 glycosyltransferase [Pseudomonadota bacterium]
MGCPESFTEPRSIYDIARTRGMHMVTITDHNTINGALEIAHLPGAFVSEEITTYFPEDRCKLHVLAYDITEAQHAEFQLLRENVFDLVPYLRAQGIVHVLAHPLFAVNDRLTPTHFEKSLLMFNVFELNGSRDESQNAFLSQILQWLRAEDMERLADKHGIMSFGPTPWIKGLVGGSDDHSSLSIARRHTEFDGPATLGNLLQGIRQNRGRVLGGMASPWAMAHNLYGIAYQFYKSRAGRLPHSHACMRLADALLNPSTSGRKAKARPPLLESLKDRVRTALYEHLADKDSPQAMLLSEASKIIQADPELAAAARGNISKAVPPEELWRRFVRRVSDRLLSRFADKMLSSVRSANIFELFHDVASAGSLYALLSPYFLSSELFARERSFTGKCMEAFGMRREKKSGTGLRVAHFTDTFAEINGVALTIQQQIELARKYGKDMTCVTCNTGPAMPGAKNFQPVGSFAMPEYPELTLAYPPFLKMLAWCFEQDFDCILTATPGPVGLAGLAIARILKIPVYGTYHTAFPQYVRLFTEDTSMEEAAWRYMRWFYGQMDAIYAPSKSTALELAAHGINEAKIVVHPRGVDAERFQPGHRNGFFDTLGISRNFKLLYVGRVSREKGLDVLAEAFRTVHAHRPDIRLVIVGDGPYLEEMRAQLAGLPVVFTGYLQGSALAEAYAGSDLFVFPSATDTFGNVVLEAQASGLPVVVTSSGGPRESMQPGRTGLMVPPGDAQALSLAVLELALDRDRLGSMSQEARRHAAKTSFDQAFLKTWDIYAQVVRNGVHHAAQGRAA